MSTRRVSISFCMVAFSRSSCSRAATPACDRASTRCTSMNPIFWGGGAGAWAAAIHTPPATATTVAITTASCRIRTPPTPEPRRLQNGEPTENWKAPISSSDFIPKILSP